MWLTRKKPELILHIGMHKTGSTSIQQAMGAGTGELEILKLGRRNNHGRTFERGFLEPGDDAAQRESARVLGLMKEQISACTAPKFLITGERISIVERGALERFKAFADPLCARIRVIGYVRAPHAFMQSHFQQRLKGGLSGTYRNFKPGNWYRSYKTRFGEFDDVFGSENVTLRLYDRAQLHRGDVVADFFDQLGCTAPQSQPVEANTSLSLEACALLYTLRKFGPRLKFRNKQVRRTEEVFVKRLRAIGQRKFSVAPELTARAIKANGDDIAWIEARMNARFPLPPPAAGDAVRSEQDFLQAGLDARAQLAAEFGAPFKGDINDSEALAEALWRFRKTCRRAES